MTERIADGAFHNTYMRALNGQGDGDDARALAHEAAYSRHENRGLQDRIHALEAQQADLLRQVKEKDAENARLQKEVQHRLDEMNLQARWTFEAKEESKAKDAQIKALADALSEVGEAIVAGTLNADDDGAPEVIRRALRAVGRL